MAEELPNLFDAVRKANRMVWEQANGGGFDSSSFSDKRKENALVWDKARGKSEIASMNIPPPTGRESPLEGADATAMVAALSAKLSELQARVDYIEDDFPENNASGLLGSDSEGTYYSLSVKNTSGSLIRCSGGEWTHKTNDPVVFYDQDFWAGSAPTPDGCIQLNAGMNYAYIEIPNGVWGISGEYPKSGTTYLRRCIFSVDIFDGVISSILPRNAGDICS